MRLLFGSAPAVRTACFTAPLTGGKIRSPVLRLWASASHYSTASGNGLSACWSSNRRFQDSLEGTVTPAIWIRRYSIRREVAQEDKRETEEELERLEMKDKKPEQDHAQSEKEEGSIKGAGNHYKIEDVMTKGKLLTTPSRLFKLLIPLPTAHHNSKHMDVEPIAILIHPQQPLSHLERLIQNEVPKIAIGKEEPRPPAVSFIALQIEDKPIKPHKTIYEETDAEVRRLHGAGAGDEARQVRRSPEETDNTFSYLRRDDPVEESREQRFVRWSESTEIGDFVRDASRAREFIVNIEGAPAGVRQIHVAVPSFDERTHFLRMRLRIISEKIRGIAEIKNECDDLAQRGGQRVAIAGFGILAVWWLLVYRLTFETDLGWDTMEPVTYLASLSTLMGGYLWFLYHNREISYRSALDFTVNARQKKLYQMKGIDLRLWESLIEEGNILRREIKNIAAEYEVYWDETKDERDEKVTEALKKERRNNKNGSKDKDKDEEDDD